MKSILTNDIAQSNAVNLFKGFQYAEHLNFPINRHITISWSCRSDYPRKGTIEEQCSYVRERTDYFKRCFSNYCDHHGIPNHLAYVHEHKVGEYYGFVPKLVHTHIGVHVPDCLKDAFRTRMRVWSNYGLDIPCRQNIDQIAGHPSTWTICHYLLKGSDLSARLSQADGTRPLLRDVLRQLAPSIAKDPGDWDQGLIHGKRCGLSNQLDRTARDRAGFIPPNIIVEQPTSPEALAGMYQQLRYASHVFAEAA